MLGQSNPMINKNATFHGCDVRPSTCITMYRSGGTTITRVQVPQFGQAWRQIARLAKDSLPDWWKSQRCEGQGSTAALIRRKERVWACYRGIIHATHRTVNQAMQYQCSRS